MKKLTVFFLKHTKKYLKQNLFFKTKTIYLLAFSGGQDSICLLAIFFILKKQFKLQIRILFCNHLWQRDAFFTFFHISKLNFLFKLPITQSITNQSLINETTSRKWRLKIFSKTLFFFNYFGLLIGHSLNDRNETFLFNFFRGSGLFGIFALKKKYFFSNLKKHRFFTKNTFSIFFVKKRCLKKTLKFPSPFGRLCVRSVQPSPKGEHKKIQKKCFLLEKKTFSNFLVLRPILFATRNELKLFLTKLKLPVFSDLTNQKFFLSRNRIRKQFIPTIRFFFNKQIDFTINKYITIYLEREQENLNFIKKFFKKIFHENKNFYFVNFLILKKLPITIQKHILIFFFKYKLKKKFASINFNFFFNLLKTFHLKENNKKKNIQIVSPLGIFFFNSTFLIFVK